MRKGSKVKVSINSELFQGNTKRKRTGHVTSQQSPKEADEISATVHKKKREEQPSKKIETKKEEKQALQEIVEQASRETKHKQPVTKSKPKKRVVASKPKKQKKVSHSDNISDGIMIVNTHQSKLQHFRDKRKGKSLQQVEEEMEIAEEKYRRRKPMVITLITLILIVGIYLFFTYGPIFGISLFKEQGVSSDRKIDVATREDDIYEMYNEQLLVYSNQKITTYDNNGHKSWEYTLEGTFTPKIYIQGKFMVVSNNATGKIYLFENKREILNKKIEGTIQNIYLDDKGNMAIEYSTTGYKKVLGVYTKSGKNLYNSYLPADTILRVELLDNAKQLLVLQADASSFKIGTKFMLIDGTKESDNMKDLAKLDNNFVYDLTIQGQNIIIVLDNKIIRLDKNTGNMTDIKKFDTAQMMFVGLSDHYYTYVERVVEQGKDQYRIQNVMFDNTVISTIDIDNVPKLMQNSGVLNYFIYQDKLQVINKWGVEVKNISLDVPPKDIVVYHNEKCVGLVYTNKIYVVNM